MSKLKVQIKPKAQMIKTFGIYWYLDVAIHLTFACLPSGRDFELWI